MSRVFLRESPYARHSDSDLVELAKARDDRAVAELYFRYQKKFERWIRNRLRCGKSRAEEWVQGGLAKVFIKIGTFRGVNVKTGRPCTFCTWAWLIVWRSSISELRKLKRLRFLGSDDPQFERSPKDEEGITSLDHKLDCLYLKRHPEVGADDSDEESALAAKELLAKIRRYPLGALPRGKQRASSTSGWKEIPLASIRGPLQRKRWRERGIDVEETRAFLTLMLAETREGINDRTDKEWEDLTRSLASRLSTLVPGRGRWDRRQRIRDNVMAFVAEEYRTWRARAHYVGGWLVRLMPRPRGRPRAAYSLDDVLSDRARPSIRPIKASPASITSTP